MKFCMTSMSYNVLSILFDYVTYVTTFVLDDNLLLHVVTMSA